MDEKLEMFINKNSRIVKTQFSTYDIIIDRIVVSNRVSFGKKGFNILLSAKMIMKKLCPCV